MERKGKTRIKSLSKSDLVIIFSTNDVRMSLLTKRTDEMTEAELDLLQRAYILSKTVNGRFCPTPDLHCHSDDEDESRKETKQYKSHDRVTRNLAASCMYRNDS